MNLIRQRYKYSLLPPEPWYPINVVRVGDQVFAIYDARTIYELIQVAK